MSAIYVERGESIDYINATTDVIEANDVVVIGTGRVGVAGCRIPPNEVGSLHVTGVFDLAKVAGAPIALGDEVKYDAATGEAGGAGGVPAGWAIAPAAAGDATVRVKIGG